MSCLIIFTSSGRCYCDNDESAGPNGPAFPRAQSIWLYGAGWGLRQLLSWVSNRYNLAPAGGGPGQAIPILVTEGGWSLAANTSAEGAADLARTYYYANYTSEVRKAIVEDKVNVIGYYAWSLMDNFGEPAPEYRFPRKCIADNTACARS